jgi:hypothetical protein
MDANIPTGLMGKRNSNKDSINTMEEDEAA